MTGRFSRCGSTRPTGRYTDVQGCTTAGTDAMHLQVVVTYKKMTATPQMRLELVFLTPYLIPGDEVHLLEWPVKEEVLERKI